MEELIQIIDEALNHKIGIGVGLALPVFLRYAFIRRSGIVLSETLRIVGSAQGLVGGFALCFKVLAHDTWVVTASDMPFIFCGGISVFWHSWTSVKSLTVRKYAAVGARLKVVTNVDHD